MKIWIFIVLAMSSITFGMDQSQTSVIEKIFEYKDIRPEIIDPILKIISDYVEKKFPIMLTGHEGYLGSISFSSDGKKLVSGDCNGRIKLWDVQTGKLLNTFTGHNGLIHSVSFSPDGKKLVSGSQDKTIKLWDVQTGEKLGTLTSGDFVESVSLSRDGTKLAYNLLNKIKLLDMQSGQLINTLTGHTSKIVSVAFSPDGTKLASGSSDKTIKLWDVQTGNQLNTLADHNKIVHSVSFSPDGTKLASGSSDKTIKLWDVQTGKLINTFIGHKHFVSSVAFSPDGKKLASGSGLDDKTIKLWDIQTGKLLNTITTDVHSLRFSPHGKLLASISFDRPIKLWVVPGVLEDYLKDLKENYLTDKKKKNQLLLLIAIAGAIERKEQLAIPVTETWALKAANAFPDYLKLALRDVIYREKKVTKRTHE